MTTTDDVQKAFKSLRTAEFQDSDLADGIRVAVDDSEAGAFFRTLRVNDFDAVTRRLGNTLVAHIPAEKSKGLGALFR